MATNDSLVQEIIKGISKTGGLTRAEIAKATGLERPTSKDIFLGEDEYGARRFLDAIEKKTGLDLYAGTRGKEGTLDNIINFITEVGTDIATDPLTLVSAPASLAGKAAIGAGLGAITADMQDPADVAKHAIVGALAMPAGGEAFKLAGKAAGGVGNKLLDTYYAATRPELARAAKKAGMTSISEADRIAREGLDKLRLEKNAQQQLSEQFLADVGDEYANKVMEIADPAFADFSKRRNLAEKTIVDQVNAETLAKNPKAKSKLIESLGQDELNMLTANINTQIGKEVQQKLAQIGDPKLTESFDKFIKLNRDRINLYNKHWKGVKGSEFKEIVPIDFHTFEVTAKDDLRKLVSEGRYDLTQEGFYKREAEGAIKSHGLSARERLNLQDQSIINNYLDKSARQAKRYVDAALSIDANDALKGFEETLGAYDKMLGFVKQQHLLFSHSWIVNNFTENLVRAYMNSGSGALWGTLVDQGNAVMRNRQTQTMDDLLKLTDPKNAGKFVDIKDPLMTVAFKHGVVDKGFFNEAFATKNLSPAMLKVSKGEKEATRILKMREDFKPIIEGKETYDDFLRNTVGKTGQAIEGAARFNLFKSHIDTALDNSAKGVFEAKYGVAQDTIKSAIEKHGYDGAEAMFPQLSELYGDASKVVDDAFFNYQNVSLFEQAAMKRIIPYWTFFSRSIPYWADQVAQQPARMATLLKVPQNLGTPYEDKDARVMPEYLRQQYAKPVGETKGGRKYRSIPNLSLFDMLNFTEGEGDAMQKISPILKGPYQVIAGKDSFGGELYPSETREQSVPMYGAATKYNQFGVGYKDPKTGRPRNASDLAQALITLQQNFVPMNLIDTVSNIIGDVKGGRLSVGESLQNLGPVKTKTLTDDRQVQVMRRAQQKRTEERNKQKKRAQIDRLLELEQ